MGFIFLDLSMHNVIVSDNFTVNLVMVLSFSVRISSGRNGLRRNWMAL